MPGQGSYGPSGKWTHDRAHRILDNGDLQDRYGDRAKSVAYALANQQAHKVGKTPKRGDGPKGTFGTPEGKATALAKYDKPKSEYRKTAKSFLDYVSEMGKEAASMGATSRDNRTPFTGGTQFPTEGSKTPAAQQLTQSRSLGNVGPNPSFNQLNRTGVNPISSQVPKIPQPKLAAGVAQMLDDPLVQYLATPAGRAETAKAAASLATNIDSRHGSQQPPRKFYDPVAPDGFPTKDLTDRTALEQDEYLRSLFINYPHESPKL